MKTMEVLEKAMKQANYEYVHLSGIGWEVIFNHEFAKKFWGEEELPINWKTGNNKAWQVHLQIMVLQEDPIKYVEKFLQEETK